MGEEISFAAGDLVRLKSGGPLMTVESVGTRAATGQTEVWCVWSDRVGAKQVVQRDTFPTAVLEPSQRPKATFGRVIRS